MLKREKFAQFLSLEIFFAFTQRNFQ